MDWCSTRKDSEPASAFNISGDVCQICILSRRIIPIFPLDLVLFPRQELPLKIFEPRYKQLVDDCIIGDGRFGVCLADPNSTVRGWTAPRTMGTIAKIIQCKDVEPDGMQIQLETVGRNMFKICKIIPPSLGQPSDYDPHTLEGHRAISELHENVGGKMYIQAEVELVPEIDENVPIHKWEELVAMWKNKITLQALPQKVTPDTLDHILEQFYLTTDVPTTDYVYSLAALGAMEPEDLQPILEAGTMDSLFYRVMELMTVK